MKNLSYKLTQTKGQMATVLNLFLAVGLVLFAGLFAFELSRYLLARDELKTNVEVAALACQTSLVSSGDPTSATNQATATAAGLSLFQQNSILGQTMAKATSVTAPNDLAPANNQAEICFQFLDPILKTPLNKSGAGVFTGVTSPSTAGTLIQAVGAYAYSPAFGKFIGLGNAQFTFQVSALSGIPQIDLMVLLDISGGMDNNTAVSFYQRYEGPTGTNWMIIPNPVTGSLANGPIYSVMCGNTGTPPDINALMPCEYQQIANSNCVAIIHSESSGAPASNGLYSPPGQPPGNYCSSTSPWGSSSYSPLPDSKYCLPQDQSFGLKQLTAMLNKPLSTAVRGHNYLEKQLQHIICQKNYNTKNQIVLNQPKQASQTAIKSDPDLLKLCEKLSNRQKKNLSLKIDQTKLDDRLSTISFAPQFSIYSAVEYANVGQNTVNPVTPIDNYIAPNGYTYTASSHQSGSGADINTLLPTVAGNCTNTPTGVGTAATNVFTGCFVNGVIGTSKKAADGSTMSFSSSAVAIEASLGDLESAAAAQQAGIDISSGGLNVKPEGGSSGWFAFYYVVARAYLQPYQIFVTTLTGFINEMAVVSNIHYGFIAFNDSIGTNASSVSASINNISSSYNGLSMSPNADGTQTTTSTYPLPNIQLSQTASNQSAIINVLPTLSMWGNRNVTQALTAAYTQLTTYGRPGANKAIVLAVSGVPNGSDTNSNAIAEAATIGAAGIPIYVVCVTDQSSDDTANFTAYNDGTGSSAGIAGKSGHGAKYYNIDYGTTAPGQLAAAFGNIARRLVSIVPTSN